MFGQTITHLMDNNKVPEYIIDRVNKELGQYPCILQTNFFKEEAIAVLEKNSEESWFNHYTDDGKFYKLEGLIKYSDTNIYIYYKSKNPKGQNNQNAYLNECYLQSPQVYRKIDIFHTNTSQ